MLKRSPPSSRAEEVAALAEAVAGDVLPEGYAALVRRAAAEVARQIPDRLASGQAKSWACAIAYALGRVNFLSDPSQPGHMTLAGLCAAFGVSPATGSARAQEVLAALDAGPLDPRWTLPGLAAQNPLAWFLLIDGVPTDARILPPDAQDALAEAGLIPFGPTRQASGPPTERRVVLEQSAEGAFSLHTLDRGSAARRRRTGRRDARRGEGSTDEP